MKKLIVLFVLALLPLMVSAFTGEAEIDNINYFVNTDEQTAEVRQKSGGYSGDVVIPPSIEYEGVPCNVIVISGGAFNGCNNLTSITIPNSVTTIGWDAFRECSNLKKVYRNNNAIVSEDNHNGSPTPITRYFGTQVEEYILGEDVTSIGREAFFNCGNLTSIQMSNNVTTIGEGAFKHCQNLTSVIISDNVTSIGQFAFSDCWKLASITIPSGVTDIDWVFGGCYGLNKVVINSNALMSKEFSMGLSLSSYFGPQVKEYVLGEEVTAIGDNAFYNCTGLTTLIIPGNVTSIGENAFAGCYSLTSVNIPKNTTSIGDKAFYNCSGLTTIQVESGNTIYDSRGNCNAIIKTADNILLFGCQNTVIPNTVIAIGDNAFYNCAGLTSITIPNSVETIGDNAFYSCIGLTSISIPDGVTSIGYGSFWGCMGLTSVIIPNSVTSIGEYAFGSCNGLTAISIPNSVTTIGDYAFFGCSALSSIIIPSSVVSIGPRTFNYCSGLTAIQVENGNTMYDSREDCNAIIETTSNTLLCGCQNTTIPNSVVKIGECAFWGCFGLTSITIPSSVTNIGLCAFNLCTELTSVTIPNSVTAIEYGAFSDCGKLATVIIGNGVTNIGKGAFYGCSQMTDMYCYAENVPELGDEVFQFWINNATLHVPTVSLEAYRNAEQWKDFGNIVALTDNDPKPTGIKGVNSEAITTERYYSIDGKRFTTPQHGLNIVKMSDGTVKKVVIK